MSRISFFSMLAHSKMSFTEGGAINAALDRGNAAMEVAQAITCPRCQRQVDRRITVMTEQGVVCDRCHALGA